MGDAIQVAAKKYQQAWAALVALGGKESCRQFRVLLDADIILSKEVEVDAIAMKQLSRLGRQDSQVTMSQMGEMKISKRHVYISQKGKTMSWIWMSMGGPDSETASLHECE